MRVEAGDVLPEPPLLAIAWQGSAESGLVRLLDQTRLPREEVWLERRRADDLIEDIRRLAVRGAPAIGLAGAFALVLAARELASPEGEARGFHERLKARAEQIAQARPTAVNLQTAVHRSLGRLGSGDLPRNAAANLLAAAEDLAAYEREACERIARLGADRLRGYRRILTHCNTGALVAPGLGTALAPLYALHAAGHPVHVWVDETRPLLQGLRLTAWELRRAGIPHAVLADGAAASLMRRGEVDAVIVGADRICANGDVANKIGTYAAAVAAHHHGVPFYVAAPLSTLDPETPHGDAVRIETRPGDLVRYLHADARPEPLDAWEPAFDVTPAGLVTALLTDHGVVDRPDGRRLEAFMDSARRLQAGWRPGR